MSDPSPDPGAARLEEGALRLFGIMRVSFQRCLLPPEGIHRTPVRSLGMLPVGPDQEGTFCVPAEDADSAFHLSGFGAIYGIPRNAESWWSFRRVAAEATRACERLIFAEPNSPRVHKEPAQASVLLVSYETYTERTHQRAPAPLDPSSGYEGWLLP